MRITTSMSANNMLRNLQSSNERMSKLQEQLSTGRKLNRPSDDPVGISRSLKFNRDLAENVQFSRNIEDAISFLDTTDSALNDIGNIIHRAKELAISGASDTLPQESRDALAKEVDELLGQAIQIANSSKGGTYIFAGHQVLTEPFKLVADPLDPTKQVVQYSGDAGKLKYEIAPNITDNVNYTGEEVFGTFSNPPAATDTNFFNDLIKLRDILKSGDGDISAQLQPVMANLDEDLDQNVNVRSTVGAKTNKMELALNRMETSYVNITEQIANNDDADIAETIMMFKLEENVYRSALSAGAKIIPPSLVDFLS